MLELYLILYKGKTAVICSLEFIPTIAQMNLAIFTLKHTHLVPYGHTFQ